MKSLLLTSYIVCSEFAKITPLYAPQSQELCFHNNQIGCMHKMQHPLKLATSPPAVSACPLALIAIQTVICLHDFIPVVVFYTGHESRITLLLETRLFNKPRCSLTPCCHCHFLLFTRCLVTFSSKTLDNFSHRKVSYMNFGKPSEIQTGTVLGRFFAVSIKFVEFLILNQNQPVWKSVPVFRML